MHLLVNVKAYQNSQVLSAAVDAGTQRVTSIQNSKLTKLVQDHSSFWGPSYDVKGIIDFQMMNTSAVFLLKAVRAKALSS